MKEPLPADPYGRRDEAGDHHRSSELGWIADLYRLIDLDSELRSLTDGIAMLGRFETQLAEYELSLRSGVAPGQ